MVKTKCIKRNDSEAARVIKECVSEKKERKNKNKMDKWNKE